MYSDQINSIKTLKKGYDYVDLSLLTDGLKSEREQGTQLMKYTGTSKLLKENLLLRIHRGRP